MISEHLIKQVVPIPHLLGVVSDVQQRLFVAVLDDGKANYPSDSAGQTVSVLFLSQRQRLLLYKGAHAARSN